MHETGNERIAFDMDRLEGDSNCTREGLVPALAEQLNAVGQLQPPAVGAGYMGENITPT